MKLAKILLLSPAVVVFLLFLTSNSVVFGQNNVSQGGYQDYWPMHLNNWWVYKTIAPSDCLNSGGGPAKSAWWVVPPDLSWRLESTRQLRMFKENACTWNWINLSSNVRWAITAPLNDIFEKKWFAHRGVSLYCPDPSKELQLLPEKVRPPFVKNNSHFMDDRNIMDYFSESQSAKASGSNLNNANSCQNPIRSSNWEAASHGPQRSSFGRGRADGYYPPYLFFPYSSNFPHEMSYGVNFTCGSKLLDPHNTWNSLKGAVAQECVLNNTQGRWLVKYIENVPVRVKMKKGLEKVFNTLKFRVFEPNPNWAEAACENWYFAEGIGPIKIEGADLAMYTQAQLNAHRKDLTLSLPASNWEEYAKSSFENRCLPFNFSESAVADFSSHYLNSSGNDLSSVFLSALGKNSGINQLLIKGLNWPPTNTPAYSKLLEKIDKKILTRRYAVVALYDYFVKEKITDDYHFQDYDSPDVMAATSFFSANKNPSEHKEMFYAKDGKYWLLDVKTGRWMAYGDLETAWGVDGSNAPGVGVNGQVIYPWSNAGPKALVFGQNVKNIFGYPALIINNGAYWFWDYNTCQPNKCVWKQSGLVSSLLGTNYQALFQNGNSITPYDQGGPRAINETWWDPNGLEVWNNGGWWYYSKDQGWKEAKSVANTMIKEAPYISGSQLTEPVGVTRGMFFKGSSVSSNSNPTIPSDYQKIFSQNGRYWINYENVNSELKWEKWGVEYGDLNDDNQKDGRDLQLLILRYGNNDRDLEKIMFQNDIDGVVNSIDFWKIGKLLKQQD